MSVVKEVKVDCSECLGDCCTFTIIKTTKLETKVKKKFGVNYIQTEYYPLDPYYFAYHNIIMRHVRKKKTIFMFNIKDEIKTKLVGNAAVGIERWFKIPIACNKLKKGKCSIYKTRPDSCKTGICPYENEKQKELYFNW